MSGRQDGGEAPGAWVPARLPARPLLPQFTPISQGMELPSSPEPPWASAEGAVFLLGICVIPRPPPSRHWTSSFTVLNPVPPSPFAFPLLTLVDFSSVWFLPCFLCPCGFLLLLKKQTIKLLILSLAGVLKGVEAGIVFKPSSVSEVHTWPVKLVAHFGFLYLLASAWSVSDVLLNGLLLTYRVPAVTLPAPVFRLTGPAHSLSGILQSFWPVAVSFSCFLEL